MMATDERLDELISGWLEASAPHGVPMRVLDATFERTRESRQQAGWRGLLGGTRMTRFAPVLGGAAVVVVAAALALNFFARQPAVGEPIASADPRSPFLGTWISTSDADGGTQTMIVRAAADGAAADGGVEIVVTDDIATVCSRGPSTMTGVGLVDVGDSLVIASPAYTCDDGSEPQTLSGPPLDEQLRDLTFVRDAQAGTLADNFGGIWLREGPEDPSTTDGPSTTDSPLSDLQPLWPQMSLEAVRQAQELADAGDPRYPWQVDPDRWLEPAQHHPFDTEFFAHFLENMLGWEGFRWVEGMAHPDGLDPGDVVFVRCAPGEADPPLYQSDRDLRGCAPTIDGLRYERVKINVAQLARQGPNGIWVVTGWAMIEPAVENTSPSDAAPSDAAPSEAAVAPSSSCVDLYDSGGTYRGTVGSFSVSATVPGGWTGEREGFSLSDSPCVFGGSVGLEISVVGRVYADACDWYGTDVEVGTPAEAVAALAAQVGHQTTGPMAATLGGFDASRFEFSVPSGFDAGSECYEGGGQGSLALWGAPDDLQPGQGLDTGALMTVYVIDVGGAPVAVSTFHLGRGRHADGDRRTRGRRRLAAVRTVSPARERGREVLPERAHSRTTSLRAPATRSTRVLATSFDVPVVSACTAIASPSAGHATKTTAEQHPRTELRPWWPIARAPPYSLARSMMPSPYHWPWKSVTSWSEASDSTDPPYSS